VLFWGLVALLGFAPLAAGSVQAWSGTVVVTGCSALAALWIVREAACPAACAAEREAQSLGGSWSAGLAWPLGAILLLGAVQLAPLGGLVGVLSPTAAEIWRLAGVPARAATISLGPSATLRSLAHGAALALLFFTVLNTLRSRRNVRRLALALVVIGFGIALFGIIAYFSRWSAAYWQGSASTASFGPYVNRNHFAGLMGLVIPLGLGYLLSLAERRDDGAATGEAPRGGDPDAVRTRQVLVGFMVAVMTGALFLSLSRGGIISVLAACAALGAVFSLRQGAGRHRWVLPVVAAVGFAAWLGARPLLARLTSLQLVLHDPTGDVRLRVWGDVLRMAADFPLLGSGLGTFAVVFPRYQAVFTSLLFDHAHNDWLQLAAEAGLAGALAAFVALGRYLARVRRLVGARRDREAVALALGGLAGLFAFLLHAVTEFNFHIPANALWFAALAALTLKAASSRL
jgi:O-antigen ligase